MKLIFPIAAASLCLTAFPYPDVDWPQEAYDEGMRDHAERTKPVESASGTGQLDLALVFPLVASAEAFDPALLVWDDGFIRKFKATPPSGLLILVK